MKTMETTTDNYLTVCDQYCDGDINLEEAVEIKIPRFKEACCSG